MGKKPKRHDWPEAKKLCRLNQLDIEMAKRLGFGPKSLIHAKPDPKQQWKLPVKDWVHELYAKKFGKVLTAEPPPPVEVLPRPVDILPPNPDWPWPDDPDIPPRPDIRFDACGNRLDTWSNDYTGQVDWYMSEEESRALEIHDRLSGQRRYRLLAQSIAISFSALPEVEKVAAFGSTAQPKIQKAKRYWNVALDLAVWMKGFGDLKALKNALLSGHLEIDERYSGDEYDQVEVHLFDFDSGDYSGRLCWFGQCPKSKRRECRVPGCGKKPFLQKVHAFRFDCAKFDTEPKVILMDRERGFHVNMPKIEGPPPIVWLDELDEIDDDDVPF